MAFDVYERDTFMEYKQLQQKDVSMNFALIRKHALMIRAFLLLTSYDVFFYENEIQVVFKKFNCIFLDYSKSLMLKYFICYKATVAETNGKPSLNINLE